MVADFTKPLQTQSSDEIVTLINNKIAALAKLSLNDGTWTNVPLGTVAFDPETNQFKRKTGTDTWSTVQLSLGSDSTLTLGALNLSTLTLVANPTSDNQVITATSYRALKNDVEFVKNTAIDIVVGNSGTDFNISVGAAGASGELGANTIVKTINLPDASSTARGVVTIEEQTFAGLKKFSASKVQIGTHATTTNNWHITSEANDGKLHISNENSGTLNTERVSITSDGKVGIGTTSPQQTLHIKSAQPRIRLEDSDGASTVYGQISSNGAVGAVVLQADPDNVAANSYIGFDVDGTQRAIITDTGLSVLGTTGITSTIPDQIITTAFTAKDTTGRALWFTPLLGNGSYNPISVAGDQGLIFTAGSRDTGNLVLAPHSASASGIKITNSGNVGIGVATPTARLHVSGSALFEGNQSISSSDPLISFLDRNTAAATNSAFFLNTAGTFYLLRGAKGSTSWTQVNGYHPLQVDLNSNSIQLGGNLNIPLSSAKLGLGTTTPNERITIQSPTNSAAAITFRANNNAASAELYIGQGTDNQAYMWNRANTPIVFGTNNLTRMTIGNTGQINFSAHTVTSGDSTVYGSITSSVNSAEGGRIIIYNPAKTGSAAINWTIYNMTGQYGNGLGFWSYPASGGAYQRMFLADTGNLDIAGNFTINNSAPTIHFKDTDNRSAMIHCNSNILYILRGTGSNTTSWLGPPYPVQINLETNEFTVGGSLYASYLRSFGNADIDNTIGSWRSIVRGEGISYPTVATSHGTAGNWIALTWASPYIYGHVDNVNKVVLGTASDYRLKANVESVDASLALISQLRPVMYNPKDFDGTVRNEKICGLIAHEVAEVIPSVVDGNKDEEKDGQKIYQSVNYSGLVPYLITAIKEQQEQIKTLQQKIAALENRGS